MTAPTHDSPTRMSVADWREQARIYETEMPWAPHLMLVCLNNAAIAASEEGRTLAEMLEGIE